MSINTFIQAIAQGGSMAMSNGYDVQFELPPSDNSNNIGLEEYLRNVGIGNVLSTDPCNTGGLVKLLCDEAALPNTQSATGQLQGRYLGENQVNYPYARFFTDFSLYGRVLYQGMMDME